MGSREREPKPVGDVLRSLVTGRGWNERMSLQRLRDAWAQVVGEQLAGRTEPVRLARGVLLVRAESGAWAAELTLLSATVASNANAFLGTIPVREVTVVSGAAERDRPGAGNPV